ncbi:MAG: hypothetical protein Q7J33_09945, partial [Serpentinimonas sp.]|nr:hypothetical protein [Serpentinimonas sp.]
ERWLRNVAVALGNALASDDLDAHQGAAIRAALHERIEDPSPLVREHVRWALVQRPSSPTEPDKHIKAAPWRHANPLD